MLKHTTVSYLVIGNFPVCIILFIRWSSCQLVVYQSSIHDHTVTVETVWHVYDILSCDFFACVQCNTNGIFIDYFSSCTTDTDGDGTPNAYVSHSVAVTVGRGIKGITKGLKMLLIVLRLPVYCCLQINKKEEMSLEYTWMCIWNYHDFTCQ